MAMTNYSDFEKLAVYFEQKQEAMVERLEPDVRSLVDKLTAIKLNRIAQNKTSRSVRCAEPPAAELLKYRLDSAEDLTAIVDQILVAGPDSVDIEVYDVMPQKSIEAQLADTAHFLLELEKENLA